jgi:hypothetical protein
VIVTDDADPDCLTTPLAWTFAIATIYSPAAFRALRSRRLLW